MKIIKINLPEYNIDSKPDYLKIGKKVDAIIEDNIPDGEYIVRAIGKDDHPELTLNELIRKIKELGTDKYDPARLSICHYEFSGYNYDIQAGRLTIKNNKILIPKNYQYKTEFGDIIWHFYEHTPFDRGYKVRIDILLFYDVEYLELAKRNKKEDKLKRKELANYLYKFKKKTSKKEALKFIVVINR